MTKLIWCDCPSEEVAWSSENAHAIWPDASAAAAFETCWVNDTP